MDDAVACAHCGAALRFGHHGGHWQGHCGLCGAKGPLAPTEEWARARAGYADTRLKALAAQVASATRPAAQAAPTPQAGAACRHDNAHPVDQSSEYVGYSCSDCGTLFYPASAGTAPAAQEQPAKYDDVLIPFLALMRRELHANTAKGDRPGWLRMDANTALLEVYWHVAKLSAAVKNNDGPAIMGHSADVANMAMMVLDVCGGLVWVDAAPDVPASVAQAQPAPQRQECSHDNVVHDVQNKSVKCMDCGASAPAHPPRA